MAKGVIPGLHRAWPATPSDAQHPLLQWRETIAPGPLGVGEAPMDLDALIKQIVSTTHWLDTQRLVVALFGTHSFGLGVVYGIGENLVTSVVEVFRLAKIFVLADLYNARNVDSPLWFQLARDGVLWPTKRFAAHIAQGHWEAELREARQERDALIDALYEIVKHPVAALEAMKDDYVRKWNDFRAFQSQHSLISQFEAGRIFGGLLLDVISLIAGGVGIAKALISAFPKLMKAIQMLQHAGAGLVRGKRLRISESPPPKNAESNAPTQDPVANKTETKPAPTPSPPPPKDPRLEIEHGKTGPNKWEHTVPRSKGSETKRKSGRTAKEEPEKTGPRKMFKTKAMKEKYIGEEIEGNRDSWVGKLGVGPVKYFGDAEREQARLTIRDGKLYDWKGRPFDTRRATTHDGFQRGIFVMEDDGNIYASRKQVAGQLHHSSLSRGRPVAMAGELEVNNGVLQYISNHSGHYEPSREYLDQAVEHLKSEGIDFSYVYVDPVKGTYPQ